MFGGISAICPQSPSVGNQFQEVAATVMVNTNEIKITTPDNLSYVYIFIAVCIYPPNAPAKRRGQSEQRGNRPLQPVVRL